MKQRWTVLALLALALALCLSFAACGEATVDELKNEEGVRIEGEFADGAQLVFKPATEEEKAEVIAKLSEQSYNKEAEVLVYDISVVKDNAKIQPNGKVKVTIPAATLDASKSYVVFHIKDDGTVDSITPTVENGAVIFETDSFSYFVIAEVIPEESADSTPGTEHTHTYAEAWSHDQANHWKAYTCGCAEESNETLAAHQTETVVTKAATATETGLETTTCTVCGYSTTRELPVLTAPGGEGFSTQTHTHTYATAWSKNDTHHWHGATCEHTDEKQDYAAHAWDAGRVTTPATCYTKGEKTYACVCGATKTEELPIVPEAHIYANEWSRNDTHHWHSATCSHTEESQDYDVHNWGTDDVCDTCSYRQWVATVGLEYNYNHDTDTYTVVSMGTATGEEIVIADYYEGLPVTAIGSGAFQNCIELTGVVIPSTVTRIESWAFGGCTALTELTIPDSVENIGDHAFYECESLVEEINGVGYVGAWVVDCDVDVTDISICAGTVGISDNAFWGSHMTRLQIPVGVKTIGQSAFFLCEELTDITISSSVTQIGASIFQGCNLLTSITVDSDNAVYVSAGNCIIEKASKTLIAGCKSSVIPTDGRVTAIGDYAFSGSTTLVSIQIPDCVETVGCQAFAGCEALASVTFGSGVTVIDNMAFWNCPELVSLTVPGNVKTIGESAFAECTGLETVILGEGVAYIGNGAFYGCTSLTSVDLPQSLIHLGGGAFEDCGIYQVANGVVYVDQWAVKCDDMTLAQIVLRSDTVGIADYAFSDCEELVSIELPNGLRVIGESAFSGCILLEDIDIPEGVTHIGSYAFDQCEALQSVVLPDSVISLGHSAFQDCTSLTSFVIGDGLESIQKYTFRGCSLLCDVVIGSSVESIEESAFSECAGLSELFLPVSVKSLGESVFWGCDSLTHIYYEGAATEWSAVTWQEWEGELPVYCYSETEPTEEGRYWHMVGDVPTVWEVSVDPGPGSGSSTTIEGYYVTVEEVAVGQLKEIGYLFDGDQVTIFEDGQEVARGTYLAEEDSITIYLIDEETGLPDPVGTTQFFAQGGGLMVIGSDIFYELPQTPSQDYTGTQLNGYYAVTVSDDTFGYLFEDGTMTGYVNGAPTGSGDYYIAGRWLFVDGAGIPFAMEGDNIVLINLVLSPAQQPTA